MLSADDIRFVAFSVGRRRAVRSRLRQTFVGIWPAWNYFMSADTPQTPSSSNSGKLHRDDKRGRTTRWRRLQSALTVVNAGDKPGPRVDACAAPCYGQTFRNLKGGTAEDGW